MNIFGARGHIENIENILPVISGLEKEYGSMVQLFRADRIFGREHLQAAAEMAARSWNRGAARARTLGMEVLLYAAAERQITGAIDKLGIRDGMSEFAIVTVGSIEPDDVLAVLNLQGADDVLDAVGKDYSIFDISSGETEMASIPDLVLERMALSELNR